MEKGGSAGSAEAKEALEREKPLPSLRRMWGGSGEGSRGKGEGWAREVREGEGELSSAVLKLSREEERGEEEG